MREKREVGSTTRFYGYDPRSKESISRSAAGKSLCSHCTQNRRSGSVIRLEDALGTYATARLLAFIETYACGATNLNRSGRE